MTVGISLTNGLEAIVITDTRASKSGRESDSIDKMGQFQYDNFHGAIYGAGSGNIVIGVLNNLDLEGIENLDQYAEAIQTEIRNITQVSDQSYLENARAGIQSRAQLLDEPKREVFIEQETMRELQRFEAFKQNSQSAFTLVAYDKDQGKIRKFYFHRDGYEEFFIDRTQIGSGSDGADMYFSTKLQGIDTKGLDSDKLAFFAANAYSSSTVNHGVGGTPKIAQITEDEVNVLAPEHTIAMCNLSGAYLSEMPGTGLTRQGYIAAMGAALRSDSSQYNDIAQALDINFPTLTGMAIPSSVWQERANRRMYNGTARGEK